MKKILIVLILIVGLKCEIAAQGIQFEHGSWEHVKQKAVENQKNIFIDFYTDWCGPCRKMSKEIFPLETVGDFYNAQFVCYKVDAEKGEGIELSKQFGVGSYPTYIYADSDGKLLHRKSGYTGEKDFIELAKIALDPDRRFAPLEEAFNNGNRDKEFVLEYFTKLRKAGGSVDPKLGIYLQGLSNDELLTQETFQLIKQYGTNIRGEVFKILIDNFSAFSSIVGEDEIVNKISKRYLLSHSHHFGAGSAEKYVDHSVLEFLKQTNYPYIDRLTKRINIHYLINCQKNLEASDGIIDFFNEYASGHPGLVEDMLLASYRHMRNETLAAKLIPWSSKALKNNNESADLWYMNASLLGYAGDKKKAIEHAEKALVLFYSKEENFRDVVNTQLMLAGFYKEQNKNEKALEMAQMALKECTETSYSNVGYYKSKAEKLIQEINQ